MDAGPHGCLVPHGCLIIMDVGPHGCWSPQMPGPQGCLVPMGAWSRWTLVPMSAWSPWMLVPIQSPWVPGHGSPDLLHWWVSGLAANSPPVCPWVTVWGGQRVRWRLRIRWDPGLCRDAGLEQVPEGCPARGQTWSTRGEQTLAPPSRPCWDTHVPCPHRGWQWDGQSHCPLHPLPAALGTLTRCLRPPAQTLCRSWGQSAQVTVSAHPPPAPASPAAPMGTHQGCGRKPGARGTAVPGTSACAHLPIPRWGHPQCPLPWTSPEDAPWPLGAETPLPGLSLHSTHTPQSRAHGEAQEELPHHSTL